MQNLLIACFIVVVCAMGAWAALSGVATQNQILKRDQEPASGDLE